MESLIENCFQGETKSESLVPRGYIGYESIPIKKQRSTIDSKLRIDVLSSIESEKCSKQVIQKATDLNHQIDIEEVSRGLENWTNKKTDVILAYIEGETTLNYFGVY